MTKFKNQTTNNTMLDYIMTNQSKYNELSEQASTQKKLIKPRKKKVLKLNRINLFYLSFYIGKPLI